MSAGRTHRIAPVELVLGAEHPAAKIRLSAEDTSVTIVRQFLGGLGEALSLDARTCEDMKLAVTEACANAVVHAYADSAPGPVAVELDVDGAALVLVVRDNGQGMQGELDDLERDDAGFGLSIMGSVSDRLSLHEVPEGGTEVRMTFSSALQVDGARARPRHAPVLRRVVSMFAAYTGFTMDRLSDAALLADALAAHTAAHSADGLVRVALRDDGDELVLTAGPLVEGGAEAVLGDSALPSMGRVIERLADRIEVADSARGGEMLVIGLPVSC